MELRLTFNEDEVNYDRIRPDYPDELYADLAAYARIGRGSSGLEIGIGTGQATPPFLNLGCRVTAVELGDKLSRYAARRFEPYPNFQIVNADFMQYPLPPGAFDFIYCATAFHWLPAQEAYPKIHGLLRQNGTLALFWNHPYPNREEDPTNVVNRKIYQKHRPSDRPIREFCREDCTQRVEELQRYGYREIQASLYHRTRTLSSQQYLALLNTYSDHRALPAEQRTAFERDMREALDGVGGFIHVYDTLDLYLARK